MAKEEFDETKLRAQALSARLSPAAIGDLITNTVVRVMNDTSIGGDLRPHAARYITLLEAKRVEAAAAAAVFEGVEAGTGVELGELTFKAGHDMRQELGNALTPEDRSASESALLAAAARLAVENHLVQAYHAFGAPEA